MWSWVEVSGIPMHAPRVTSYCRVVVHVMTKLDMGAEGQMV